VVVLVLVLEQVVHLAHAPRASRAETISASENSFCGARAGVAPTGAGAVRALRDFMDSIDKTSIQG
jgi:hypothetical protein